MPPLVHYIILFDNIGLVKRILYSTVIISRMICLWGSMKKKPLAVVENAHGTDGESMQPNWVNCIASLLNTDLIASGSNSIF
jgi:hypothetical protein